MRGDVGLDRNLASLLLDTAERAWRGIANSDFGEADAVFAVGRTTTEAAGRAVSATRDARSEIMGADAFTVLHDVYGAPYLRTPEYQISLSDEGDVALALVTRGLPGLSMGVGIDVGSTRYFEADENLDAYAREIASHDELQRLRAFPNGQKPPFVAALFCLKEAVIKSFAPLVRAEEGRGPFLCQRALMREISLKCLPRQNSEVFTCWFEGRAATMADLLGRPKTWCSYGVCEGYIVAVARTWRG